MPLPPLSVLDLAPIVEGATPGDALRNSQFGMIFQFYHLLPEMTALENVLSPKMISDGILKYWRRRREHPWHSSYEIFNNMFRYVKSRQFPARSVLAA